MSISWYFMGSAPRCEMHTKRIDFISEEVDPSWSIACDLQAGAMAMCEVRSIHENNCHHFSSHHCNDKS